MSIPPNEVTSRAEFAAALTALRERAGLSVRELARRVDTPTATLGGWFSGRHAPSAAQVPLLRAVLEQCGVTGADALEEWVAALQRSRGSSDRRRSRGPAPYRGLTAFEPDDAELFFGRADEVRTIVELLDGLRRDPGPSRGMLAVVGPSGSGKSSLLRAGVVAALRAAGRTCVIATPGVDPLASLEEALLARPQVLVLDQFEELFTATDAAGRSEFLRRLVGRDAGVLAVLGLRADFYPAAAREPELHPALQHAQVLVGPLSAERVREVIVRPATAAGGGVDDALVELILADLAPHGAPERAHDAGALPLLSHALLATWERAAGRQLTIGDYRATGGLQAAVQRTAEELFGTLSPAEQELTRRIFLRLVNLDDEVALTRRRAARAELERLTTDDADAGAVIDEFVDRRLLTAHSAHIEITHEALLAAWPRLRDWLDADRTGLRLQRQIIDAATAWQESGHDPALLWRGGRLEAAREWAGDAGRRAELSPLERDFVDTGAATAAAETTRERRRSRRLKQLLAVAAVLAVVAGTLAAYALSAQSRADRDRRAATVARDDALSRQVAVQSEQLDSADPALAQQLALVAYRVVPSQEARGAVTDASAQPIITRALGVPGPTALAVAKDGALIAVGHADDGSVHLYARPAGRSFDPVGTIPGPGKGAQVFALAFSPDGRVLATGGEQHDVHLWDVHDPAHPRALATLATGFAGAVESIAFRPDGTALAAGSGGPHPVVLFDVTDPAHPGRAVPPKVAKGFALAQSVAFSPDGRWLAAGGTGGVLSWPADQAGAATPAYAQAPGDPVQVNAIAFSPRGDLIYAGDQGGALTAWTAGPAPTAVHTWKGASNSQLNAVAVAPDGTRVAVGRSDDSLEQFTPELAVASAPLHGPGPVTGVAYAGDALYWTAADGTVRSEPARNAAIPVTGTVFNLVYSKNGSRLAIVRNGDGAGIQLWDVRHPSAPRLLGPTLTLPEKVDGSGGMNSTGTLVAGGTGDGHVALWDTSDPTHPRLVAPPFAAAGALVESIAFSPDDSKIGVASDDGTLSLWSVTDPAHPRHLGTMRRSSFMLSLAFSPTGTWSPARTATAPATCGT